jgi:Dyp-type peroxidase family
MNLTQTPPFLICVLINRSKAWPGLAAREIEALLDRLGNPANDKLRAALDASRVIHFLSLSVVWDEGSDDPPVLVADIAGDGKPKTVIAALVNHAYDHLIPVFQAAAGVSSKEELQELLERHWVKPVAASWSPQPHRATGLPFQGTPGLTVERIKADECIVRRAKAAVLQPAPGGSSASLSHLRAARAALGIAHPSGEPFNYSDDEPSLARASPLARAWTMFGLFVIDWSFMFVFLLSFMFLIIHDFTLSLANDYGTSILRTSLFLIYSLILSFILHVSLQSLRKHAYLAVKKYSYFTVFMLLFIFLINVCDYYIVNIDSAGLGKSTKILSKFDWQNPLILWMALVLSVLSVTVLVALVAGILLWILWEAEKRDRPCDADPDPKLLAEIMRKEDRPPYKQNHMIAVSTLSPGFFRQFVFLPIALYAASLTVRSGIFRTGWLAGIRTIHFLQWAYIPRTGKFVFTANYDGSFQSYLEDAISLLPTGASAIWSNAVGFPKTRWLFWDGAEDGDRFKRWVRRQMIPTRFWYSAYPHLTTTDIRRNAAIRQGLEATTITASQADVWLKLFGSAPRPPGDIETDQIQGLALSGYRDLLEGTMLAISFSDDQPRCRAWLASVAARIHFGDARQSESAMAVALSARGLERLGLGAGNPLAARFSPAFAMGMTDEARATVLGDVGKNGPETWDWGGPRHPVDAVLLIYARDQKTLRARLRAERRLCVQARLTPVRTITLRQWPSRCPSTGAAIPITEPFGFADGISQPSIIGLLSSRGALESDLLAPGEFILGYPDNRHTFPSTPQVLATDDPEKLLSDLPANFPPPPSNQPVRDLGRNGSYLVIRQLRQDVHGFWRYMSEAARRVSQTPDWVAAKIVGRWQNGAPLVLFPHGPPGSYNPTQKDEEFLFGRDDPQGLACPFGAHTRRANPRDHFNAGNEKQMSITNRHRILRRGRSYVPRGDSGAEAQGLLFMCLNADIERQFEFLQQTWIGSTSFSGLRDEADPLTTLNRTNGTYTIPTLDGPTQLTGMPSFVRVIGGGYFFLPGRQTLNFLSSSAQDPVRR